MTEIRYWIADDGTKFEYEYDCIQYERKKKLEEHKNEFKLFNFRGEQIPIEKAEIGDISYIVIKSENCTELIRKWYNDEGYEDPFNGIFYGCVGTWVYGDMVDRGDEWIKLEDEIEKIQNLINMVNK